MSNFRLISTSRTPPGGWRYRQPETGWNIPANFSTFEQNIQNIVLHRQANPNHRLSTDYDDAAKDLEQYMCAELRYDRSHCVDMVVEPPKPLPPVAAKPPGVKFPGNVVAFVHKFTGDAEAIPVLGAWLGDGMEPVSTAKASSRARICLSCPLMGKPRKITGKIAETIKKAVALKSKASLILMEDEALGSCTVCGCHLPLKVWVPTKYLHEDDVHKRFPSHCWMRIESDTGHAALQNQRNLERFAYDPEHAPEPPSIAQQTDWPTRMFRMPPESGETLFNPGLWERSDGLWLMARKVTKDPELNIHHSTVVGIHLNSSTLDAGERREVRYLSRENESLEDPRVIPIPGKKDWAIMSVCNWYMPNGVLTYYAHVAAMELDSDFVVRRVMRFPYGNNGPTLETNRGNEKNWTFFIHEGALCFVYQLSPLIIAGTDGNSQITTEWKSEGMPGWAFGIPRGGTPPVQVGNEYFTFFHSSQVRKPPFRRYFMGAIAFEAKPPFRITRWTVLPLLAGSAHDPLWDSGQRAVFPCGAVIRGGEWIVSLGVNDCACALMQIPHEDLLRCMTSSTKPLQPSRT